MTSFRSIIQKTELNFIKVPAFYSHFNNMRYSVAAHIALTSLRFYNVINLQFLKILSLMFDALFMASHPSRESVFEPLRTK